jgi:integrase/recombinase XerC
MGVLQNQRPDLHLAEPSAATIDLAAADFLFSKATRADKTRQFYELALRLYVNHVGHHWPPSDSSINSFLADCKARGCKDGTLHAYYRAIRAWCNWLHQREKIEENPIRLVTEPPRGKALPRAPRASDLQALFECLGIMSRFGKWTRVRDLALFSFLYDTGARVGEASALEMPDLTVHYKTACIRGTKTDNDRVVVFEDRTAEELKSWLTARQRIAPTELEAVFVSRHRGNTGPLTPDGMRRSLRGWCEQAKIPRITPHDLRHAYAIHALRAGGDILDVQRQLGHTNLATTQRYLRVVDAGRTQRHARHSPRRNLERAVKEESGFVPPDLQ